MHKNQIRFGKKEKNMLRLLSISILVLLLCSCMTPNEALEHKLTSGTIHISSLIEAWGEPNILVLPNTPINPGSIINHYEWAKRIWDDGYWRKVTMSVFTDSNGIITSASCYGYLSADKYCPIVFQLPGFNSFDGYGEAEYDSETAAYHNAYTLWPVRFENLHGERINRVINMWGKPEKIEDNVYHWVSRYKSQSGGYYVSDGTTRHKILDEDGYTTGYIETPRERYVEPYTTEGTSCEIRITVNKNGVITHAEYKGHRCKEKFPFSQQ